MKSHTTRNPIKTLFFSFCTMLILLSSPSSALASVNFSGVEAREIRDTSAIILWHAEVSGSIPAPLTGQVEYGLTTSYGSQTDIDSSSFFHSITLTSLTPGTIYHYRLRAKDSQDVETISDDYTFTTLSDPIVQNITGVSPNASGNTTINDDTTWQGITVTCGGNIAVGKPSGTVNFTIRDSVITVNGSWRMGGDTPVNFTLINSTVVFNVTSGTPQYINQDEPHPVTFVVDGNKMMIVGPTTNQAKASRIEFRDSNIRGTSDYYRAAGVYIDSGYTGYASPNAKHTVIIDNVTLSYIGGLVEGGSSNYALNLRYHSPSDVNGNYELADGSLLTNIKIMDCGGGIRTGGQMKVDYAYAENGAVSFMYGSNYEHLYMNKSTEGLYEPDNNALVTHSWFDANGTKFNFNTGSDGIFEYNYVKNANFNAGDVESARACGNNITVRNNILYHSHIGSRTNYTQIVNNTMNIDGYDVGMYLWGTHQTASGNTIAGTNGSARFGMYVTPHPYTTLPAGSHTINGNTVTGTWYGIMVGSLSSTGNIVETDNKFTNNTISNTTVGWGISLADTANQLFIDTTISNTAGANIYFAGNNTNAKFINTQFNPAKISFSGGNTSDIFLPYSYLDLQLKDQSGNPISGATITVTNEIDNTNYPSINIDGTNKSTFTTDSQGYIPLPSDTANSIAILDYTKTSNTQTEMTYTITATKNGRTTTVTGINPDATWYRTTPDTRQNTVTLTLDMSVPVYALTINQGTGSGSYAQNQTVTITANSAPSGQSFDRWTGDTQYLSNTTSSTATVTIPAQAISLTATYKNIVTGGTGGTGGSGGGITSLTPVIIKTEVTSVTNNQVNLTLNVTNVTQMMLSDNSSFTGSTWETYATTKTYTKTDTQTKLYLKFKSSTDTVSSAVELTIPITTTNPSNGDTSPYPTGTLLKLPDSFKVYVIIDTNKKWIPTPEVFEQLGYKWTEIKILTPTELNNIPDYEDNLIRAINDYKVYLVVNGVKRHIPNPIIFLDYGFKWEEVKDVPQETIDKYKNTYLIKQSGLNGIYYVNPQEIRKLIPSTEVFNSYNDKNEDIQIISKTEMDFYPLSNLIKLNGSNDIYLIEGNIKKRIPNPQVFNKYKLNWNLVMSVNQTEFDFYQNGGELK